MLQVFWPGNFLTSTFGPKPWSLLKWVFHEKRPVLACLRWGVPGSSEDSAIFCFTCVDFYLFFSHGDFTPDNLGGGCCSKEFGLKFVLLCVKRFVRDFYFLHGHDSCEFWFRCWCCSRSSRNEMLWEGQRWKEVHPFQLVRCSFHLSIHFKGLILIYAPSGAAGDCPRFALGLSARRGLSQPWSTHMAQGAGNALGAPWEAEQPPLLCPWRGRPCLSHRILMDLF